MYSSYHNEDVLELSEGSCGNYEIDDERTILYAKKTSKYDIPDLPDDDCSSYIVGNESQLGVTELTLGNSSSNILFSNQVTACRDLSLVFSDINPQSLYRITCDKVIQDGETIQLSTLYSPSPVFDESDVFVFNGTASSSYIDGILEFEVGETSEIIVNICMSSAVVEFPNEHAIFELQLFNEDSNDWESVNSFTVPIRNSHD